jgi:hypothetical protein
MGYTNKRKLSKFAPLMARQISRWYSTLFRVAWSTFGVTIATASLIRVFRCWRSLVLTWKTKFFTQPHKKKSNGVNSGDLGGQAIGPPLPIHLPAISLSRWFLTWWQKCGGAPSSWRIVSDGNWGSAHSSGMSKYERPVTDLAKEIGRRVNSF